jgi:energy-coupling factor transporter ATP-binding protein EcfA2
MTWLCQQCGTTFCNDCWARQISHKPGKTGLDGMPHEKADRGIVTRLAEILAPPANALEQHLDDEDSTWFGVDRDEYGGPVFRDYGQYATLIGETASAGFRARYPRLVSFVGQTGSGKSTLVKTLVDQQARDVDQSWQSTYPSPVVGSPTNDYTPTSADVHLYVDPATCTSQFPMLYADCEGLDGGEQLPVSSQYCNPHLGRSSGRSDANKSKRRGAAAKLTRGSQRALNWADSPEKQKRQYAVTELYPRLLYTFSDVIVFVVRNAK